MATQRERQIETRRLLLSAARQAFAEIGYPRTTVNDIVQRAGRSHGSFYLHFVSKEAALQALLEDAMAQLSLESKTMWRWDEPGTSVRKTVYRFIESFGENQDLWLLLAQRSSLEPTFKRMSDQWFQQIASSILRGIVSTETPRILGLDPEILAPIFAAMLSESTRAAYQENHNWTTGELADEISRIWSLTLGYNDMPPRPRGGFQGSLQHSD